MTCVVCLEKMDGSLVAATPPSGGDAGGGGGGGNSTSTTTNSSNSANTTNSTAQAAPHTPSLNLNRSPRPGNTPSPTPSPTPSATGTGGGADGRATFTTACNHTFHMACLGQWQDSPCPVCRYHHNLATISSQCMHPGCRADTDLLVCVICGFVGCGRRGAGHAREHYEDTLHAYALEIDSQQAWDFAGDGYVHRLIVNKGAVEETGAVGSGGGNGSGGLSSVAGPAAHTTPKLVEHLDPRQHLFTSHARSRVALSLSDHKHELVVHRKLEGLAIQYNELLTGQLEAQRHHYEAQLQELKAQRDAHGQAPSSSELLAALGREKRQLAKRCEAARKRLLHVHEETKVATELNKHVGDNADTLDEQIARAEDDLSAIKHARGRWVPELEAKVEALMLKLDGLAGAEEEVPDAPRTPSRLGGRGSTTNAAPPTAGADAAADPAVGRDAQSVHNGPGEASGEALDPGNDWLAPAACGGGGWGGGGSGCGSGKKKKKKKRGAK